MNYGRAIRIARAARRLSQKDLATLSGLDASYISLIEAERRDPSTSAVSRLGRALGIPPHLLTLLATDPIEANGIQDHHTATLAQDLLSILVSFPPLAEGTDEEPPRS